MRVKVGELYWYWSWTRSEPVLGLVVGLLDEGMAAFWTMEYEYAGPYNISRLFKTESECFWHDYTEKVQNWYHWAGKVADLRKEAEDALVRYQKACKRSIKNARKARVSGSKADRRKP